MDVTTFFRQNRTNLIGAVLALGLFGAGGVAVAQQRGIAGVGLFLAGFVVLMFLEYRHIEHAD